ncbi:MAG: hypothetical protein RLZZ274_1400 [Cyanobacteriota bacterium]|jgi:hypothetical protein
MGSESKAANKAKRERLIEERQELEKARTAMTPEERQRDLVRRQAENFPTDPSPEDPRPEIKEGPRGGRYTEDTTKDGRPYRRYF